MKIRALLMVLSLIFIVPFAGNLQTIKQKSLKKDTLNIDFVLHTKGKTRGTLFARWNCANIWSKPTMAAGKPKDGLAGRYHVRYTYKNEDLTYKYNLTIEKQEGSYSVSWTGNGKVFARALEWKLRIIWQTTYLP